MRKSSVVIGAVGVVAAFGLAACSSSGSGGGNTSPATSGGGGNTSSSTTSSSSSGGSGGINGQGKKVGIILPDTTSSPRWITADPTALAADCKQYNLSCDIQNADGSAAKMKSIAQQMESNGVKALMIVDLDSASGAAIEKQAKAAGVIPIDYDRLTLGGGADLYISYNNVVVGQDQGKALTQCPQVKGSKSVQYVDIDGAPTDNNATLFAQGYNSVLSKTSGWTKVADQTGQWDAPTAGRVFNAMLAKNPNIKAVMVANDTMAGAVITDLKRQGLNGKVAVSGQDASAAGLQQIMAGNQCFSIYKPSQGEALPAVKAMAQLVNGQTPTTNGTVTDPTTHKKIPAILGTPTVITKANVALPINQKYTPKNTVCTKQFAKLCTKYGVK
ncbi:sugar ABC transporter substrate-binding protein [Jatrophihabitans endophyticus]|uniref:sugar ABC transporter substrate-binding protein n=1 Tax=Jatrophihabitans endophyticus TaxID=1206085 RepID=UPI0019EB1345|nr:substrate-binding domain-containing protein [Jatrophihabitans endophyticus]MBE7189170.1 substrate-binding domain-containing protein [Jatrophihabitans endophyticus]